jgi:DNA invertase Pin-like site-specific DNA recombinase
MLTRAEIISSRKKPHQKVDDQELRKLPYKQAFIYGRVSTPEQVRDSKESIREIAKLVKLAIEDGYRTHLVASQVDEWLDAISKGTLLKGVLEDGQVTVDVQDLGISGQLTVEDRKGMADLQQGITTGKIGAVYVTEGVSRLSRDRDRILPYQLLKLLKDQQVRLRTPEGIWTPAIERDWDYLAEEFDQAIVELKTMNKRMFRRKAQKAGRGEFVGEPVPLGFMLPISGRKPNGQYEYGKYVPYPPHAEMVRQLLQEYVRVGGSLLKTMRAVKDLVIPFFPPELSYMEHLSSLRRCKKLANGYEVSPTLVINLATNLKLIGVWQWGNNEAIPNNHPAVVPEELFAEAFELATRKGKPKGRAAASEPLEWSGLLYCHNHAEPRRVTSHSVAGYYACDRDYKYAKGPACLYIRSHFLDEPLSQTVLSQLELAPCIEEIIFRLEGDASKGRLDQIRDRQQILRLEKEIKTLKALLPCCVDEATGIVDREKEKHYWGQIREAAQQLQELQTKPATGLTLATPSYAKVRDFLRRLPVQWSDYSRSSRNRFLKVLIDRVELKGNHDIEATIYWKAGFRQQVIIHRNRSKNLGEKLWTEAEDKLLRMLFPGSPQEVVLAALPGRSWKSIVLKAARLNLKRRKRTSTVAREKPWTEDEDSRLKLGIETGSTPTWLASELNKSLSSVSKRIKTEGLKRFPVPGSGRRQVRWEVQNLNPHQELPSGRSRGILDIV